jgi:hypothetical protein
VDSPVKSGVNLLAFAIVIAPSGVIGGLSVTKTQRYRPQMWFGWTVLVIGAGLYTTLHADTEVSRAIGLTVPMAVGIGILTTTTYFPVLAPRKRNISPSPRSMLIITAFFSTSVSEWASLGVFYLHSEFCSGNRYYIDYNKLK